MSLRRMRALGATLALAAAIGASGPAAGEPSVWARAREPELARRQDALAQTEPLLLKYRRLREQLARAELGDELRFRDARTLVALPLRDARKVLEDADAATSPEPLLRLRLAQVLEGLDEVQGSAKLYDSVARDEQAEPALRLDAWSELAVAYAKLGLHQEEIDAYGEALDLEPLLPARSRLLSNRAEAFMALGDISRAVAGYREALALLMPVEMPRLGVTTLWGLAVAADRSGDLEEAIRSIGLARAYDPVDGALESSSWFYVPAYDEAWYKALGHWARARTATLASVRAEAYGRAVERWHEYIARAPAGDHWLAIAKARLARCEKEREAFRRSVRAARPAKLSLPIAARKGGPK